MAKQVINNIKLGIFVLAGLLFLVLMLFMIGKNENLFGNNYILKSRFENVQGLVVGNNVRYSGIQIGTVSKISILNDTTIEITMLIQNKMKKVIKKNAITSVGTDGLVGNKVVNILPFKAPAALAMEGDVLDSKKGVDTDDMMQTLSKTNTDVASVAASLKRTVENINNSNALWSLLNDNTIPQEIRNAAIHLKDATGKASHMAGDLEHIIADIRNGKGSVGILLKDTGFAASLSNAVNKIKEAGNQANTLTEELRAVVAGIQTDVNQGKGTVHALLKDSLMVQKLNASLQNIEKGTADFSQNMEALKHNFLFRSYFKKQAKKNKDIPATE